MSIRSVWYEDRPTDTSYPKRSDHRVTAFFLISSTVCAGRHGNRQAFVNYCTEISPNKLFAFFPPQKDSFTNVMVKQDSVYSVQRDFANLRLYNVCWSNIKVLPSHRPWPRPKASPESEASSGSQSTPGWIQRPHRSLPAPSPGSADLVYTARSSQSSSSLRTYSLCWNVNVIGWSSLAPRSEGQKSVYTCSNYFDIYSLLQLLFGVFKGDPASITRLRSLLNTCVLHTCLGTLCDALVLLFLPL